VSDQDFFFDDEEEQPAKDEKSGEEGTSAKPAAKKRAPNQAKAASPASASFFDQTVTMAVASLMSVIALLAGVIVGIVIPAGNDSVPPPDGTTISAPQLSPEQLESGSLPQGHPDIGSMTGGDEAGTDTGTDAGTDTGAEGDSTETTTTE
jgi:hypothetical protein